MWVILALSALIVGLVHWFLTSPYDYWRKRGVPGPKPSLVVGNLGPSILLKRNLGQIYQDIYNDYKDSMYVGYYKFRTPGIIVRDMELMKNILVKDFASFHDNDIHISEKTDPLFSKNPFSLKGQKWKEVRSLITSGITPSKVKNMFYLMSSVCDNLVHYVNNSMEASSAQGIEVKELAAKFTTDVVASCAFGLEAACFTDKHSEFREMGKKFISPDFWIGIKHMLLFIMPSVYNFFGNKLMPTEVEKWFTTIVTESIKYREKNNIARHDYLDLLIGLREKSQDFKDVDVVAQALTFYGDGFETSSIALSHTLYELADNPDIQAKLRKEIDTVLAKHNGQITYDGIAEMGYLDNVLNEGLRLHTPVLFQTRVCTNRYELPPPRGAGTGPGVVLEPGTPVVIPILAIHLEPRYYPRPLTFDPDRFTEENRQTRPKCTFLAFGEGPRICLGTKFGLAQTKAALVAIISNFEVKVSPKTQKPLQLDPQYFMANTIGGLWLNFAKRQK